MCCTCSTFERWRGLGVAGARARTDGDGAGHRKAAVASAWLGRAAAPSRHRRMEAMASVGSDEATGMGTGEQARGRRPARWRAGRVARCGGWPSGRLVGGGARPAAVWRRHGRRRFAEHGWQGRLRQRWDGGAGQTPAVRRARSAGWAGEARTNGALAIRRAEGAPAIRRVRWVATDDRRRNAERGMADGMADGMAGGMAGGMGGGTAGGTAGGAVARARHRQVADAGVPPHGGPESPANGRYGRPRYGRAAR
jgi:hypothetical protein